MPAQVYASLSPCSPCPQPHPSPPTSSQSPPHRISSASSVIEMTAQQFQPNPPSTLLHFSDKHILIIYSLTMEQREFLINISNLPLEQRKHCTELLHSHDIVFEQENEEFTARIVIDPSIKKSTHGKIKDPEPKKNITEVVSMESFKHLVPLMKTVEVYVCPKKVSIEKLETQLQLMLQNFFKSNDIDTLITHNLKGAESFPEFFHAFLSRAQTNKIKFQQNYVNVIESINHFKSKYKGVKVFEQFLSLEYGLEEMLFFYFLRKMIESLLAVTLVSKNKLKVSLYNMILEEEHVLVILESYLSTNYREVFEEIKREMHHDQKRKKNVIGAYEFIYLILINFNKREESVDMREQLLKSLNTSFSRESLSPQNQETESQFVFTPEQNVILLGCLEGLKRICEKVKISESFYDQFSEMIVKLLICIFNGDKLAWFEEIRLEPTNARLHYFETLQQDYQEYTGVTQQTNLLLNRLTRRVMQAPGLQECYARLILRR